MPHTDELYHYGPLSIYPHMGPLDTELWNKFVIANPDKFDVVIYDMRCGEVEECDHEMPKNIKDAWTDLCRGRIDVVAFTKTKIYVIEVKPRARGEALGQAINNAHLYKLENKTDLPIQPVVITDIIIPGTRVVAAAKGILLWTPELNLLT